MRGAIAMCIMLVTLMFTVDSLSGQDCDLYANTGCGPSIGHHMVDPGGLGGGNDHGSKCFRCFDSSTGESVTPDHCHECEGGGEGYEEVKDDPHHLIAAIEAGKLAELLGEAPVLADRLHINHVRSAMQIRSACTREFVVAHVPMSNEDLSLIERTLWAARWDMSAPEGVRSLRGTALSPG